MKKLILLVGLYVQLGLAQSLTILEIKHTTHTYAKELITAENYFAVLIDCHSFLHGIFLYQDEKNYYLHNMDEESCSQLLFEGEERLKNAPSFNIKLLDQYPYYQEMPTHSQQLQ
jgi:hypothetical protein